MTKTSKAEELTPRYCIDWVVIRRWRVIDNHTGMVCSKDFATQEQAVEHKKVLLKMTRNSK